MPGASCYGKERRREMRSPRESGSPFSPRAERGARMGARDPLPLGRQRRAVAMELLVPGMRTRCAPSPQAGAVRGTASGGGEGGPGSIGSCRGCACPCGKAAAGEARRLLARALLRGSAVRAPPPPSAALSPAGGTVCEPPYARRVLEVPYDKRPCEACVNGAVVLKDTV